MSQTTDIKIFMDESGKDNDISLFGGVSIPTNNYNTPAIQQLNTKLVNGELHFHFTKYTRYEFQNYYDLIHAFLSISDSISINIIAWKKQIFTQHGLLSDLYGDMVYSKIPERVCYGLLRNHSNLVEINADLFIENSTEYQNRKLNQSIKQQVNTHALYRYDLFRIRKSLLAEKNVQIGLEFTDTLIGIIRFIMVHASMADASDRNSNNFRNKVDFIKTVLPELMVLIKKVNIFELTAQDHLTKISLPKCVSLFEANTINIGSEHIKVAKNYPNLRANRKKYLNRL
ncbi:hypothetical protein [Leuconostoc carnosum]|uniref:hypothetical protein n=1 Tax=Leuconostoc carnosum TaxID=1252 RepID=UPI00123AD502|nr:hypothetical protein [Leuconostoc carnosum]KAA8327064.1 hypothetical protein FE409_08105 [Leuconostoc carnosum]